MRSNFAFVVTLVFSLLLQPVFAQQGQGQNAATPSEKVSGADLAFGAYQRGYYLTAVEAALQASEKNDPAAQTLLGVLYLQGLGVLQDDKKAAEWFEIAAASGHREGLFEFGLMLVEGRGLAQDRAKAADMFEKAAAQGHVEAAYNLGLIYLNGTGRQTSIEQALQYFNQAADAGYPEALYGLGLIFKEGKDVAQDLVKAARFIGTAAQYGLVAAQVDYGIMVFRGEGTAASPDVAAQWLLQAVSKGNPVAMNRMARLYARGLGVEPDVVEAAKLHNIAKTLGVSDLWLDSFVEKLDETSQKQAEQKVQRWFSPLR